MNIWEEFPENARRMAVEVANHVIDSVRFVPWTPEQMGAFWRRRSYDQIVASGEVNVCVPCIDTAALATVYLHGKGLGAALRLYTGQGAAEDFVAGKKRKLHLDATTLFFVDGQPYELDIGAGDITLLKDADVAAGRLLTTRPNEPFW
ncbi:MAG: hypothetical protein KKE05_02125, partial [Nanoarchaeota archaeon]|nr:hypothetical protein [Nanoarchaeota archaeon]